MIKTFLPARFGPEVSRSRGVTKGGSRRGEGRPDFISSLSSRTLRLDGLTNRGDDLAREGLDLAHMVLRWPVDKGVHPELQRETRQLLGPPRNWSFQKPVTLGSYPAVDV